MKAARRHKSRPKSPARPRNPVAVQPLLQKGGAHQRKDAKAPRARQKRELRRRLREESGP